MGTRLLAALLGALSASLAAPAFASGYGPAPFYQPSVGAPTSQRVAEPRDAADTQHSRGGVPPGSSQSGRRASVTPHGDLFGHR
ncbi:hypothetical protein FVF58_48225 [Paraburkholderia panacisoli]|uniref:Uncharacterized protein n=1 Tax=Paraburkholderia panacisoli TaxID=2603818 RepID=A0A5B0G2N3_9BURK|nr:hypothetical protein [Paraburkholderia panacisoli]KAA0997666.1 hypothetical protein FVF58_48225 [Paraburkholderia panacisoli]